MMKKRNKKIPNMGKGMPSAVILSILIHAALFLLAGMLVVFTVVKKDDQKFKPPKAVERPKMKLKKPKVKVKKTSKPKPTTRIVTKLNKVSMPDIQLPEMSGMNDGLSGGIGGFDMLPDLDNVSVFGGSQTIGNDFEGQLYDLKRNRNGGAAAIGDNESRQLIDRFILGGWKESNLARYYRAPNKLYTTHFIVPPIPSPMAPDVFGAPEMESYYFFVKYKGDLVYPKDIKFRFWGTGDAFSMIRVGGKLVFLACWPFHQDRDGYFSMWESKSADSRKFFLGNQVMAVGDWIELKAGEPVEMELMYGEWRGGQVACMILVEVDGVEYPQTRQGGPLLPAFKTEEFTQDQLEEIRKYLPEGECNLTNGPVFRDFNLPESVVTEDSSQPKETAAPAPMGVEESESNLREWVIRGGRTVHAEFITLIAGKVSLKNKKGKSFTIPIGKFSDEDRKYIQLKMPPRLDINFSKSSAQRTFPFTLSNQIPRSSYFTFKTIIKKASTNPYHLQLTVESFAIGREFAESTYILLDYQKRSFTFNKENKGRIEFSSPKVEVIDFLSNGQRRGEKFVGYLIVVTDERGDIIAYNASSEKFFKCFDNLKEVPVGKYFDDTGTRTDPSRPKRFY